MDASKVEVTIDGTTTVDTGITSTTVAPISGGDKRRLQAVSTEIVELFQTTLEDIIKASLPETSRLLSVTITSVTEVEGVYTIDYQVALEELLCDSSDPGCDQSEAGSSTFNTVTSTLTEKAEDGGFATTLAANAADCGAACDGFESASVTSDTFSDPVVVVVTSSPSVQPSTQPSVSMRPSSSLQPTEKFEESGSKSAKNQKSGKSSDGVSTTKSAKSESEGMSKSSKRSKSAKSVEIVEGSPAGAEWVCGWQANDAALSLVKDLLAMVPEDFEFP